MGEEYGSRVSSVPEARKCRFREFSLTRYLEEDRWAWRSDDELQSNSSESESSFEVTAGEWYWDKRMRKAVVPVQVDDRTVRFLSVWHTEEVQGALRHDQLVPLAELGPAHKGNCFEAGRPLDSFRILDQEELETHIGTDVELDDD